jgi:hypothetical protein
VLEATLAEDRGPHLERTLVGSNTVHNESGLHAILVGRLEAIPPDPWRQSRMRLWSKMVDEGLSCGDCGNVSSIYSQIKVDSITGLPTLIDSQLSPLARPRLVRISGDHITRK